MKTPQRHQQKRATAIHNNTSVTRESIEDLTIVGKIKNNWRKRDVILYQDPDDSAYLFMVGTAFDGSMVVISRESIGMNESIAMDYWTHGNKTLVRE